jgi:hypothetical protein
VKQTVENRRPSKMGDVATLLFVHFNFIIHSKKYTKVSKISISIIPRIYMI